MKWVLRLFKFTLYLGIAGALAAAIGLGAAYYYLEPSLPDIDNLREVRLQVPLKVLSRDGELIAEFGEKRRNPLGYEEIPERMVQAFLAAEDDRFFEHPGVDYQGLLRAGLQLALTGEKRQGGSTITMQVARNFYLTRQKTYTRKLSEIFLALRIEQSLTKPEILELYLNKIYLGHRAYGVGAAAQVYYGKTVDELDLAQVAMIAGLPKAPSRFNPLANPPRALERRDYVLGRMLGLGFIDRPEYEAAIEQPVTASRYAPAVEVEAPYVAEMVRLEMVERFGEAADTGGYRVYTTILGTDQAAANNGVRNALDAYSERHGYHGPEDRITPLPESTDAMDALLDDRARVGGLLPALVTSVEEKAFTAYLGDGLTVDVDWGQMDWARPYIAASRRGAAPKTAADIVEVGDLIRVRETRNDDGESRWRLAQIPRASAALVALSPDDGAIRALVGGYDFYYSKFNRVTQASRQPGSGFKAFIYSAALENGFTPASLINDAPVVFEDPSLEGAWRPENYSGKFFGPTRLRYALTKSRNLVSIRLLRSIGIERALEHIARFGFDPDALPHNLSLALGSANVTPLQMASAYAVLANGGYRVEPYFIERIEQDDGEVIFEANPLRVCRECPEDADTEALTESPAAGTEGAEADGSLATAGTEADPTDAVTDQTAKGPRHAPRVIDARNRYLMYSMLQDVVRTGTATRARALGRDDIAGKTGTTNDQRDAWFNGFNQDIVANAWVGFDDNSKLGRGEVGGRAALPAWLDYMKVALDGLPDREPTMPEGIETVRIDPRTGLRASAGAEGSLFEVFRTENAPDTTPGGTTNGSGLPAVVAPPTQELF
jgi:penicillin-binding protein 1A